ncbi:MAG: CRISPR-associated endonuclease Cas2 [Kiritimatiellia bacterium]
MPTPHTDARAAHTLSEWWREAFEEFPSASDALGHPCGAAEMLIVIAYDITDDKRLPRVAKFCEDFGIRVQYSVFECRLTRELFNTFWDGLKELMDPAADRIVAYRICESCSADIRIAGRMACSEEPPTAYIL